MKALHSPESFVRDAKLREHGESLTSIQASLCEQKQEVSNLVQRIENLIAKKVEIVEEAEESTDQEGEDNVADNVEDVVTNQNQQLASIQYPIQNFTPMTLPYSSPYTMFPNAYSMHGYGYGQGIGGFSPYFPMMTQNFPTSGYVNTGFNNQPSYLADYYGVNANRAPSSYGKYGTSEGFTLPSNQMNLMPQGLNGRQVQFGNDFTSNASLANPSYQIQVPNYSRNMITSTPFKL